MKGEKKRGKIQDIETKKPPHCWNSRRRGNPKQLNNKDHGMDYNGIFKLMKFLIKEYGLFTTAGIILLLTCTPLMIWKLADILQAIQNFK